MKHYTYADYTYPIPIRTYVVGENIKINVHNDVVGFIVNEVMNIEERTEYINLKRVSMEKIIQLCDRIIRSHELQIQIITRKLIKQNILDIVKTSSNPDVYNLEIILATYIWEVFSTQLDYVVATKIH
jgi:hypothetical protein